MDNAIAELLKDLETGTMNRRQLFGVLGLMTAAALTGGAALRAAARRVLKVVAVNHISYSVADYARSRDFYVDLLGMKVVWDDNQKCAVEFGDPPNQIYLVKLSEPGGKANVSHMAYSIENFNLKTVEAELKSRGLMAQYDGEYAWTTQDPDGYRVQPCAIRGVFPGAAGKGAKVEDGLVGLKTGPKSSGKGFKAVAVNHISYNVADYARSRDFYVDLFGMKVVSDDGQQCVIEFGNPPQQIYIRKVQQPGEKANVDHIGYSIDNFNLKTVGAELKRRGLNPQCDGPYAWTINDPDGFRIQICARTGVVPGAASSCK